MAKQTRVLAVVAAVLFTAASALTRGQAQPADQAKPAACAFNEQGVLRGMFTPGSTATTPGGRYHCVVTFDADLKPSGVAWVKVE